MNDFERDIETERSDLVTEPHVGEHGPPKRMRRRQKLFAVLPTLLTLGNAACGFGAITFAAKVGPTDVPGNEFLIASTLIFLAMFFDMLDGRAARWANQTSEFGAQLDSLCDALSFGAAPAFLMLRFVQTELFAGVRSTFEYPSRLLWWIAALYVICAILRLARFNVETDEEDSHDSFSGLPSPAAAGTVASFPIAVRGVLDMLQPTATESAREVAQWLLPAAQITLPLITFAVACLMVSRIRYSHVFNQLVTGKRSRQHVIQLVFTIAIILLVQEMAVPVIFCYFAFAAPLRALWQEVISRWWTRRPQTQ
ncbi:MAG: CDP-alcohol phosphatidyltransferase family protein [Planctomycetaceae bacterium]